MTGSREVIQALRGDRAAALALGRSMLQDQRESLAEARSIIEQQRAEEWDEERLRRLCIDGDLPEEVSEKAYHEVHDQVVEICGKLPLALLSDAEDSEQLQDELKTDLLQLAVKLANPTIKYGLLGLIDAENREVMIENVHYTAREIWETAWVLTDTGEIEWSDFPPDTQTFIEASLQAQEEQLAEQQDEGQTNEQ